MAHTLTNLGNTLRELGDLPGAQAAYQRAPRINETAYGPHHHEVTVTLTN